MWSNSCLIYNLPLIKHEAEGKDISKLRRAGCETRILGNMDDFFIAVYEHYCTLLAILCHDYNLDTAREVGALSRNRDNLVYVRFYAIAIIIWVIDNHRFNKRFSRASNTTIFHPSYFTNNHFLDNWIYRNTIEKPNIASRTSYTQGWLPLKHNESNDTCMYLLRGISKATNGAWLELFRLSRRIIRKSRTTKRKNYGEEEIERTLELVENGVGEKNVVIERYINYNSISIKSPLIHDYSFLILQVILQLLYIKYAENKHIHLSRCRILIDT